jgi:hypothetical protein
MIKIGREEFFIPLRFRDCFLGDIQELVLIKRFGDEVVSPFFDGRYCNSTFP